MCRVLYILSLLSICWSSVYSQGVCDKVAIKNDTVVINQDTLVIDKTGIEDMFTKVQIDSLGSPCEVHWDGNCDSGIDYEYRIKRKNYEVNYISESRIAFILNTISIKNVNNTLLFFGEELIGNKLTHKDIKDIGFKKEQRYEQKKSEAFYEKEGIRLEIDETSDNISIKSIHIHPKSWDKHLKLKTLKGEVSNNKGELLPDVMLLAYNEYDSLKYHETTNRDGKINFDMDAVKNIDIFRFNYHQQTVKLLDNKDQTINFELKKRTYFLPDLLVTRRRKVEIDSICYLDQFPKVRDVSKINIWSWCDFTDYNPLVYNIPSAIGGLKNSYENLVSSLSQKKKLRKCTADVYLTIDKNGHTKIDHIVCDEKINEELLARDIIENLTWVPVKWTGTAIDSSWSLKLFFE